MKIAKSTRTLVLLVAVAAALVVLRLIDKTWAPSLADMVGGEEVLRALNNPWFVLGGEHIKTSEGLAVTPVLIVQVVLFILLLTIGARLARRLLQTRILGRTSLDTGQQYALARIFGYFIFFLGLAIGLQTMGVDLSSLTFLGGAVGIGIGFGLQAIINNFVSGLIMLVERPIKVGDRIEVGGTAGDVVKIGPRSTWIRGIDNAVTIVPNSEFVTGRVTNMTALDQMARYRVSVGVAFDTDPEQSARSSWASPAPTRTSCRTRPRKSSSPPSGRAPCASTCGSRPPRRSTRRSGS